MPGNAKQGMRELIYANLTNGNLVYRLKGQQITLPDAQVIPHNIWLLNTVAVPEPPPPYLCFSVDGRGGVRHLVGERHITVKFWIVSSDGPDECNEIYEAVRTRMHLADQQQTAVGGAADASTPVTSTTYGVAIRHLTESHVSDADYHAETKHWFITAEYDCIAN